METGTISIYIGGALTLLMAVFHLRFYALFKWEKPLQSIGSPNSKIFYTIHVALLLLFFFIAIVSLLFAQELGRSSGLSMALDTGLALFWLWRAAWQVWYFSKARGVMHYALTVYFILLMAAYGIPVML